MTCASVSLRNQIVPHWPVHVRNRARQRRRAVCVEFSATLGDVFDDQVVVASGRCGSVLFSRADGQDNIRGRVGVLGGVEGG